MTTSYRFYFGAEKLNSCNVFVEQFIVERSSFVFDIYLLLCHVIGVSFIFCKFSIAHNLVFCDLIVRAIVLFDSAYLLRVVCVLYWYSTDVLK